MKDLTKGKPIKLILQFAIPVMLGNIFQLFYSLADTRIVGSCLGEEALAAVGSTSSLNSMIVGFLLGLTNGFAIISARSFGAKDEKHLKRAVAATFELGILTSLALTIVSVSFLPQILKLLNTPENLIPLAVRYFRVILLGMTVSMLYNVCSGLLRAIGDTVTPLIFLILSTFLNVGLNLLLIKGFGMGVEGAAYATVLSQGIAFVSCLIYLWKKYPILHFGKEQLKLSGELVREMYATGLSMGFMGCLVNIGSVALQSAINTFGDSIIVAHTAARKISELFMLPFSVFGITMATYCGQNKGAGRIDRVRKGLLQSILLVWVWCLFVILAAYTVAPWMIRMVTATENQEIIDTASRYLRINTPLYFICTVICLVRNGMQGIGDSVTPIVSSFIELVGKVVVAFLLAPRLGYMAIMISEPLTWIFMVIPLLVMIRKELKTGGKANA
ncbi:MAG: MATE family efflux transporter [Lachnospiraceae bacterium]